MILKRICACLIAALIASIAALPVFAEGEAPYVVTLYNETNGLPTGEANEVIQTSDGYIWIGSYGGLIRYDGSVFRNYSLEGAIPSSSVRALHEDAEGRLWIGTNDAGVFCMENGVISKIGRPDDNSFLCIRDFCEDKNGTIYLASNSGMAYILDGVLTPIAGEHSLGGTVYSVGVDSRGRVWGALNAGVCVVTDGKKELCTFVSADFFDTSETAIDGAEVSSDDGIIPIYCLESDNSGRIWLGTNSNVLAVLSFNSDSLEPGDFQTEYSITDGVYTHNSIRVSPDGSIIVCGNVGACVIRPDGTRAYFSDSERAASLNSGCVDYEGNVWLASTAYGVIKYTRGYFYRTPAQSELNGLPVNAVTKQDGYMFVAADSGLFEFDSSGKAVENSFTELYSGVRVRSLLADSRGNIWAAAYSPQYSVTCYNPKTGEIKTFGTADGLLSTNARTLCELSDGGIAVGTQQGLNIIRDGVVCESYGEAEGIATSSVLCTVETKSGSVLVGSDGGGIYEIKDGNIINHGFSEGLSDGVVLRILEDGDTGGFFISAGSSLYYMNDGGIRKLNIKKGAGSIFDFVLRDKSLWVMQNSGILKFDREAVLNGEDVLPKEYGIGLGLSGSLNANTWNWTDPEDGSLYLSTRNGVSIFRFESASGILPKGILNSVNVDGVENVNPKEIHLKSDSSRVTFDFSVLTYTETSSVGIDSILEGVDREVSETLGENTLSVSYTNLPGGEYNFRVTVFDLENPNNRAEYIIPVTKEKKLYEHVGFIVGAIMLGVLLVVGIVILAARAKVNTLRKRQREYRSIVEQSLQTFARSIDAKDRYTNGHSMRVAEYSRELSKRLGMSEAEQERVYYIALLHDIGKIGIPDSVLNKPGKLTEEEMDIIRNHPKIGGEILKQFTAIEGISDGAKYHHERIDGKGYNSGLSGDEIPLIARIIGVADTYDAMSSDRPYRKALSREVIESELKRVSGTQLDKNIVPHMLDMIEEGIAPLAPDKHKESSDIGTHYHM